MSQHRNDPVELLIEEYVSGASQWAQIQGDAAAANPVFDRLQQLQKVLRTSTQGRAAMSDLITSEVAGVRLIAATHVLAFDPDAAVRVLEELEVGSGLHALSAKYTLLSYRAGKLDLDW